MKASTSANIINCQGIGSLLTLDHSITRSLDLHPVCRVRTVSDVSVLEVVRMKKMLLQEEAKRMWCSLNQRDTERICYNTNPVVESVQYVI
jgi:hypothetical protein